MAALLIIKSGNKMWFVDNTYLHRTDGPAIEWYNGANEWYLHCTKYSFEEYVVNTGWSDEQIVMYKSEFG